MARSPAHRFGQIIGDMLEEALRMPLQKAAKSHSLYLDWKHNRSVRSGNKLVKWKDSNGNSHDLDYVLEEGGSETKQGHPKAFIEIAYRRYTKHSRNKAQEIQGAILPLAKKYKDDHPFLGVVLAGVFTGASLTQLESNGFEVLFFPFESIVKSFKSVKIDAFFDESTDGAQIQAKVDAYEALSVNEQKKIARSLRKYHKNEITQFIQNLEKSLNRSIEYVILLTLHGERFKFDNLGEAVQEINTYEEDKTVNGFIRYEVTIRYNNHDEIRGSFQTKSEAVHFLNKMR